MERPLQQALLEYSTAIVSSTGGHEPRTANDNKATTTTTSSSAKDGIHSLTKMVDASLSQIDEVNLCASQIENDTTVLREALLPQLASNTEHLKQMFQTIDALGTFVDQMERTTREAKEQVQQTQKGYDARHPKKMERLSWKFQTPNQCCSPFANKPCYKKMSVSIYNNFITMCV